MKLSNLFEHEQLTHEQEMELIKSHLCIERMFMDRLMLMEDVPDITIEQYRQLLDLSFTDNERQFLYDYYGDHDVGYVTPGAKNRVRAFTITTWKKYASIVKKQYAEKYGTDSDFEDDRI